MTYQRPKSQLALSKLEKVDLMAEYIKFYENLIEEHGLTVLNAKIPREVFHDTLDDIGTLLSERAQILANEDGQIKEFLQANPLPPHMQGLLPDEFRAFALLLNALKQWVSAESAATDRFLLGGTARATCRAAVDHCIVTGGEFGESPELHHPMRDGRPPILLSKQGHDFIEQNTQGNTFPNKEVDDEVWLTVKRIRTEKNMSWVQLREGCNAILADDTSSTSYRPGAKSFASRVLQETGLTASELIERMERRGL